MVNLDEWFPNFDLFVMQIIPALIMLTLALILMEYWTRKKKVRKKREISWMDTVIWFTAVYLFIPIYRIIQFVQGDKSYTVLVRELFIDDFYNYMAILLVAGIAGAIYIMSKKVKTWEGS